MSVTSDEATAALSPPADATTTTGTDDARRGRRVLLVTYVVATFLAATLLFLVEPMVAKMLLPRLGGSPAVWNTATVFFQMALLAGYAIAHLTLSRLGPRRQSWIGLAVVAVAAVTLPIAVPLGWKAPTDSSPALWTLLVLTVMVGAPFFALSTISPTLQRWFSATDHPHAADPYFLYAAGNTGSLLALLLYPLVIEPNLSLDTQSRLWSLGYLLFFATLVVCAVLLRRHALRDEAGDDIATATATAGAATATAGAGATVSSPPIAWRTRGRWIFLAAIPAALMLSVTHFITTDIASMPLLWVLPLSLYLLTFIIVFGRNPRGPVFFGTRVVKLLVVPLALSFLGLISAIQFELPLHLAVFFFAALVAHGRLSMERPAADRLTEFYLLLSVGGMVGGVLAALVAPVVFRSVLEYPIAIVLSLAVLPAAAFRRDGRKAKATGIWHVPSARTIGLATGALLLAVLCVVVRGLGTQQALTLSILIAAAVTGGAYIIARTPLGYAAVIGLVLVVATLVPANPTTFQERTFFGVHRVYEDKTADGRHVLLNGRTVHGMENRVGDRAGQPLTYYHRTGPIGQWFAASDRAPARHVGVIGLGSGALAYYGRPGDTMTYYEIDPAVVGIAANRDLFSFIPDSKAKVDYVVGDGRLELESTDQRYDLLVGDAFSSDAIPLHLITNEALGLYESRLTDHGVLAFHISNRYFDFAPVLARLAAERGMVGLIQTDQPTDAEADEGKLPATWVLMARSRDDLAPVVGDPRWQALGQGANAPLWTDQYADLLHVLRLEG